MRTQRLLVIAAAVLAGGLLLSACAPAQTANPDGTVSLRPALSGERRSLLLPGFGRVNYYADPRGTGRPLVLTHSVNAAASAYEMKPLWDSYAGTRPVYALEWPGFGSSARPDVTYTPELMASALRALVDELGEDVDVVSLSLGSEFVARAALQDSRIRTLALISPSGFGQPRGGTQRAAEEDGGAALYNRLNSVGDLLYGAIRTRPSIQYFLSRSFRGPVPGDVIDYSTETSRQPGAKYAPLYFISGRLFGADAYGDLYSKLNIPTLVLYDQDGFVSFDRLPLFAQKAGAKVVRIPDTDGLPQFEKLPEVRRALNTFWAEAK
ncbi:alpha/beta fold hydrolase [uncultured Deinococcus sp.]|uniref:alpha/beta fold hydrolase n=1 Tax=uncultured Deinococcus sp. TaxID=158789 RepID=UPI00259103B8|nr:alpha/beta fold hydrolase [uncultured Deinococcus sp.]